MRLEKVNDSKIYIKNNELIYEIDVSKNELYEIVRENNFSNVELELFLKAYNQGVEKMLSEKITPEYSNIKFSDIEKINIEFEKDYPFISNKIK